MFIKLQKAASTLRDTGDTQTHTDVASCLAASAALWSGGTFYGEWLASAPAAVTTNLPHGARGGGEEEAGCSTCCRGDGRQGVGERFGRTAAAFISSSPAHAGRHLLKAALNFLHLRSAQRVRGSHKCFIVQYCTTETGRVEFYSAAAANKYSKNKSSSFVSHSSQKLKSLKFHLRSKQINKSYQHKTLETRLSIS